MDAKLCAACKKFKEEKTIKRGIDYFHEDCCVCHSCKKLLTGDNFFLVANELYCQDCFDRDVNKPCKKCGRALDGERVRAGDSFFHKDCFRCSECHRLLDHFFYPVSLSASTRDYTYFCPEHFNQKYGSVCSLCSKVIEGKAVGVDERRDLIMHMSCFRCQKCDEPIQVGRKFFYANDLPLCENCNKGPRS